MGQRAAAHNLNDVVAEAARIICEEAVLDYRSAKAKAAQRLGLGPRAPLPDNAQIEAAVIDYQRLFGGADYAARLRALRTTAVHAMRLLAGFSPRLVGGAVSGAVTRAHRVQLHAFADRAESLEIFLDSRGIACEQAERNYRFPRGDDIEVPLVRFEAGAIGVDVAVFEAGDERRLPLSPTNGLPVRRLDYEEAVHLAAIGESEILASH